MPTSGASRQSHAPPVIRAAPRGVSTSSERLRRLSATTRPSPTQTSEAAIAITASAKIWPAPLCAVARERDQGEVAGVQHQLEREQHDERVAPDRARRARRSRTGTAASARYQATSGPDIHDRPLRVGAEDHAADRSDEQHDRRDLEREQVVGEEDAADPAGRAELSRRPRSRARGSRSPACPTTTTISTRSAPAASDRADRLPARAARPRRLVPRPDVRDHEQEHHDDRARVDEHLRGRDELRRQQQVHDGERAEVPDQRERRVERVLERVTTAMPEARHEKAATTQTIQTSTFPADATTSPLTSRSCRRGSACRRDPGPRRAPP